MSRSKSVRAKPPVPFRMRRGASGSDFAHPRRPIQQPQRPQKAPAPNRARQHLPKWSTRRPRRLYFARQIQGLPGAAGTASATQVAPVAPRCIGHCPVLLHLA
ncbi:uncharacterized protein K452DRAFT_144724 [Aplosporella prunicola CBS 121167]|uniref:Uncharacterized protein n=1 Tax=Aplosporella prunicola CBS 121167 TaxID=1176127 RepID=A0A6A6BKH5_9PEZI|nr:uncharacterized protein K452DRAFT_144724 [Aplosporella prunicola CBS 121167]KAF2144620.1 hypothetical protein K452DRAFT_144724 [Aplosporella prunicola CBS 121167]